MAEKEYIEKSQIIRHLRGKSIAKYPTTFITGLCAAADEIIRFPAADVVEVRHGEWGKEKWKHTDQHICSLCHSTVRVHPQSVEYRYCPYCGAKMDGDGKSNG